MPGLLCNACNAEFPDEATQKAHYRSEWHQYNLRRKVAGVPGVTEALFNLRLEALAAEKKEHEKAPSLLYKCDICDKEYRSMKAHSQHLHSKLHVQKAANSTDLSAQHLTVRPFSNRHASAEGNEKEISSVVPLDVSHTDRNRDGQASEGSSDEWEEIDDDDIMSYESHEGGESDGNGRDVLEEDMGVWDATQCFFCDAIPDGTVEGCLEHMHKHHGFFIPDAEFLKDPCGLLSYLGLKVTKGFTCLYCDDRGKQFQSLEAVRKHMLSKSHCKLRYGDDTAAEELEDFYDFSSSYMLNEDLQIMAVDETSVPPVFLNGSSELVLRHDSGSKSSARILGCRNFARYYKQRPPPSDKRDSHLVKSLVARYKSMGLATRETTYQIRTLNETKKLPQVRAEVMRTRLGMKNNVIRNLPKNVTH